eukprot:512474-Hanusia_phi.AAC.2
MPGRRYGTRTVTGGAIIGGRRLSVCESGGVAVAAYQYRPITVQCHWHGPRPPKFKQSLAPSRQCTVLRCDRTVTGRTVRSSLTARRAGLRRGLGMSWSRAD